MSDYRLANSQPLKNSMGIVMNQFILQKLRSDAPRNQKGQRANEHTEGRFHSGFLYEI